MDERERSNWTKVMKALEEAGITDSYFYRRAKIIAAGGNDPLNFDEDKPDIAA